VKSCFALLLLYPAMPFPYECHLWACSEWRYFNYRPKILRFMPETGVSNGKEAQNDITLSQYSAASVPKYDIEVFLA